jgi:hypothetical protein
MTQGQTSCSGNAKNLKSEDERTPSCPTSPLGPRRAGDRLNEAPLHHASAQLKARTTSTRADMVCTMGHISTCTHAINLIELQCKRISSNGHRMKSNSILKISILFALLISRGFSDPSANPISLEEDTLNRYNMDRFIQERKWDLTNCERIRHGMTTLFKRDGELIGYCVAQSEKRRLKPDDESFKDLNGTTHIIFGDPTGNIKFKITDPVELKIWENASREHTWVKSIYLSFNPLTKNSPIQNARIDISSGHGCNFVLHFYRSDDEVCYYPFHENHKIDSMEVSNPVLESLILYKMSELNTKIDTNH